MTPKRGGGVCSEAKREKCRNKEARRAEQINGAFNRLLGSIPYIPETHRPTMPKIKTLRLAMRYIQHLTQLLEGQWAFGKHQDDELRPLQFDDFRYIADGEIKIRNTYRERAQKTEMDYDTVQRIHQRNEQKRQQRCTDRLLGPHQQQLTFNDPIEAFAYSTSSMVQYSPGSYNDLHQQQQQMTLPHVETVYGSCSPPEFSF